MESFDDPEISNSVLNFLRLVTIFISPFSAKKAILLSFLVISKFQVIQFEILVVLAFCY